ncbi:Hypothetical protein R9X50_00447900 [Acrodontium crateriforme]|uniref:Serine hydrolase domain-containing protein n=1 Tax=Acrodontium crateriforme TaxID=150365 RepID=A0AAQ3M5G2_9PEZI|nr:Hypothetical protein R9X50_00447900 [Acrodontium crateriforme]
MATTNGAAPARKLKILMLHGYTQSGHLFNLKSKALQKHLAKSFPPAPQTGHLKQYPGGVEFHYPDAPIRLSTKDIPGFSGQDLQSDDGPEAYGWWRRKGDGQNEPFRYEGIEKGMGAVAEVLKAQGPFDGVVGFSQGGAAAGLVASLLEPGRKEAFDKAETKGGMPYPESFVSGDGMIQPPLRFAVSYAGFGARANTLYQAFYDPKISTPMCHFLGTVDTVVEEERSLKLVDSCVDGRGKEGGVSRLIYHPGGHVLASQKQYMNALVAFLREALGESEIQSPVKKEERAEDMDLPF